MTLFEKITQVQAMFPEVCEVPVSDKDQIAHLTAEIDRLREALKIVTVNLIACHSLLGSGGKRAAASDKMFEIMMSDYAKAIEIGRATAWPEKDK